MHGLGFSAVSGRLQVSALNPNRGNLSRWSSVRMSGSPQLYLQPVFLLGRSGQLKRVCGLGQTFFVPLISGDSFGL
jgi:hypothetical protein